jgi:hypothetical protein
MNVSPMRVLAAGDLLEPRRDEISDQVSDLSGHV